MRVSVLFQLRKSKSRPDGKSPLYLRCTMGGQRFEVSTGFFLEKSSWIESAQLADGKSEEIKVINNRLTKIRSKILDIYNQLDSIGEPFDILSIRDKFLGISNGQGFLEIFDSIIQDIEATLGNDYSPLTLKQYKTVRRRFEEFLQKKEKRKDIPVAGFDFKLIKSFDVYLKSTYHVASNTAFCYHKIIKKVLNQAVAMNYLLRNPYSSFKLSRSDGHRDFLTLQEVKKIHTKELAIPRMQLVRDIFVFACYTGLSYVDISKLNSRNIQKGNDGNDWIILDRTKTESRCRIPVLPVAQQIMMNYKDHPVVCSSNKILPVLSNQKMNSYLKELADLCEISKNLSMHVARHTFATSVTLSNGVPIETVSKMLGHTSLKTTQIYARIVDSKISEDMNQLKFKLR
ncbi:MAG: site-specific integrase [Prolixibacteraceae bacterium]|jgi:site-specific recombinase XerD|nr:site-specific integrase [Prolixibacteraceae bacterium]